MRLFHAVYSLSSFRPIFLSGLIEMDLAIFIMNWLHLLNGLRSLCYIT